MTTHVSTSLLPSEVKEIVPLPQVRLQNFSSPRGVFELLCGPVPLRFLLSFLTGPALALFSPVPAICIIKRGSFSIYSPLPGHSLARPSWGYRSTLCLPLPFHTVGPASAAQRYTLNLAVWTDPPILLLLNRFLLRRSCATDAYQNSRIFALPLLCRL